MEKMFENRSEMIYSFEKNLKIAELGVFEGNFSKEIYKICEPSELYLVDLFDGYFGSGDKDGNNYHYSHLELEYEKIKNYFAMSKNVKVIKDSTINFLNNLEDSYLDIVYIDADHSYNAVTNDLELSFKKVKDNGLICGHDYVINTEAKSAIDNFCVNFNLNIKYLTNDGCPSFCIIKK